MRLGSAHNNPALGDATSGLHAFSMNASSPMERYLAAKAAISLFGWNRHIVQRLDDLYYQLNNPGSPQGRYDPESANDMARARAAQQEFDPQLSRAWKGICDYFAVDASRTQWSGKAITRPKLEALAGLVVDSFNGKITPPTRDHRRRKGPMIKWFEENWNNIGSFVENLRTRGFDPYEDSITDEYQAIEEDSIDRSQLFASANSVQIE
jgi:hypothetical protein